MIFSLLLALIATTGGALVTYLYDEGASLASRVCTGVCVGLTALGLIGFVFASFLGLNAVLITLSDVVVETPFLIMHNPGRRSLVQHDLARARQRIGHAVSRPSRSDVGYFLYYALAAVIF